MDNQSKPTQTEILQMSSSAMLIKYISDRYTKQQAIYTWCGLALVAVNPYQDIDIYGKQAIETYYSAAHYTIQLDPHIFALAQNAYSKLENSKNQSIIVSGESGAGKTVSAKLTMNYFASIASSRSKLRIETRILASNPIMEAIGNAKTIRNDNSSRFGKYIQIYFDRHHRKISGGNMSTYLLEKSRVTSQQTGERNFHIFYELVNYARKNHKETSHLNLSHGTFKYLNNIEPHEQDDLTRVRQAFTALNLDQRYCFLIERVIAGILHGGNIKFKPVCEEQDASCTIDPEEHHLKACCELLGFDIENISQKLTLKKIKVVGDEIFTPMSCEVAEYGRDAMFKTLYDRLFICLVGLINTSLGGYNRDPKMSEDSPTLKSPYKKSHHEPSNNEPHFIGVLDIYGFENFNTNSFEQFCINYANEVLQQQFNQHVFKLEQEEYAREGIDWTFIEFKDNQPVIDIIESKPIGILNLLDEDCRMPKSTDVTWCAKLYEQLGPMDDFSSIFIKPKIDYQTKFTIAHYAENVTYTVHTFLEKNRDALGDQHMDLLRNSSILSGLFETQDVNGNDVTTALGPTTTLKRNGTIKLRAKTKSQTVATQFRASLNALMKTLNSTEPHYIRCIKPNDEKKAFMFNEVRVVEQLRACGVYETIKISTNGFPSRWLYKSFAKRFSILIYGVDKTGHYRKEHRPKDARIVCEEICHLTYELGVYNHLLLPEEKRYIEELKSKVSGSKSKTHQIYQFGKTKIFFRAKQEEFLERIRIYQLRLSATTIQRHIRGFLARQVSKKLKEERRLLLEEQRNLQLKISATTIQRYVRGFLARQSSKKLKKRLQEYYEQEKAAIIIQTSWRRHSACRKSYTTKQQADLEQQQNLMNADEKLEKFIHDNQMQKNNFNATIDNLQLAMVRIIFSRLQTLVIEAILEYDGLDSGDPFASLESLKSHDISYQPMDTLINELDSVYELLTSTQINQDIFTNIWKQLFYLVCAQCLNQLLVRKDLCHWNKAIQIRFNLSTLEQWCREKQLWKWQEIVEQLDPITQSTKLLQTRKTSEHIPTIVEMCSKLRPSQIVKILNMYTSSYEEQISSDFIKELEVYLCQNNLQPNNINQANDLFMHTSYYSSSLSTTT